VDAAPSSQFLPGPDGWHPYGSAGWLGRWEDGEAFARLLPRLPAALERHPPRHLTEYVPGFQTLLLLFSRPVPRSVPESWWDSLAPFSPAEEGGALFTLPVNYDGADLEPLSQTLGLSVEEIIRIHSSPVYTVRMLGFSPGFPYLWPLDPRLHVPRKATPRTRIEPGTVAMGGPHTGIYTVASPGGWHLLGRTTARLFLPDAARAAAPQPRDLFLLQAGDRVRFEVLP
jgi:KipI family sensor histidine kinase inhibitor